MAYVNYDPSLGAAQKQTSDWGPLSYRQDQLRKSAGLDILGRNQAALYGAPSGSGEAYVDQDGRIVEPTATPASQAYTDWLNGAVDPGYTKAQQEAQTKRDASQVYQQLGGLEKYGLNYKNEALDSSANRETIAQRLGEYGITNLQDLGSTRVDGKPVFYNRSTGQALPSELGYTSYGNGFTKYKMQAMPDGSAVPVPVWEDSSDNGKIAQAVAIAAMVAAPWALPALGAATGLGAAGAGALYGGASGALTSGIGGGNILKGGLTGALAGGIGGSIGGGTGQFDASGGIGGAAGKAINSAASGALTGGLRSGLQGQNVLEGAALGGVSGGLGSYANSTLSDLGLGPRAAGFLSGQLSGAAKGQLSQLFGQNSSQGSRSVAQPAQQNQSTLTQLSAQQPQGTTGGKDWNTFQQYLKSQGLA